MRRAIRKYATDFAAIIALAVLGLIVGGVILANQRFYLPGWVPVLGTDFFELKAEFQTAQSVTPGQGQTVNIAGVKVGEISKVELVDGRAVVTMRIRDKYAAVYRDATMLLRPKTGLNDMVIELTPGSRAAGKLSDGATLPIQNTLPNVNTDEILAALDQDTRDYLRLLLGGGAEGLRGQGRTLSAGLRRLEPTGRDALRITRKLAERRRNVRHVMHNFQLLASELAKKDDQLAALVDSSNTVFRAFADQDARLREALGLLPGTLDETQRALGKADRLARELGPTLEALRPTARALGPTLRRTRPFLRATTPVIEKQLRPFTKSALPTVRLLRPAARDLAAATPDLTTTFEVLDYILNELAYNPPGPEEGYLFWLAWANHNAATVFATQDAHGPIRHGLFLTSCSSLGVLDQVSKVNPVLATLTELLNAPRQSDVCPAGAGAPATRAATKGGGR